MDIGDGSRMRKKRKSTGSVHLQGVVVSVVVLVIIGVVLSCWIFNSFHPSYVHWGAKVWVVHVLAVVRVHADAVVMYAGITKMLVT